MSNRPGWRSASPRRWAACLFAAAAVLTASQTLAQSLPTLTEPVTDLARVIDPGSAAELDRRIRVLERATGDAVVVLTVPTFAPYGSIEEYAVKVFERSGPGARNEDNGLLIVLAVNERRVRIEVGYALEEFVTDGFAGDTIRQTMLPAFREGEYGAGLLAGATRIIQRIADRRNVTLTDLPPEPVADRGGGLSLAHVIIMVVVLLAIIGAIRRGGGGPSIRRRGGWPTQPWGGGGWYGGLGGFGGGFGGGHRDGGFGGGFGGFGGGRSGGGGASGGW
ncbi:MAG: TPM domain-containing protein [Acidobacteria bacterium]|nr:TPM domain-containing protein [Acidobacteriota bacterium]